MARYPLYARGTDKMHFARAVFLLNKDVEQLLQTRGLDVITQSHTLANLRVLLLRGATLH